VESLAQRVGGGEFPQARHQHFVSIQVQVGLGTVLQRLHAQLLQSRNDPIAQHLAWHVQKRRAAPQFQRSLRRFRGGYPGALPQRRTRLAA
jgi:hypothetical protein